MPAPTQGLSAFARYELQRLLQTPQSRTVHSGPSSQYRVSPASPCVSASRHPGVFPTQIASVAEGSRQHIRLVAAHLRTLHLHDTVGLIDLHLVLGLRVIDWPEVHAAIAAARFAGSSTIEVQAHEAPPGAVTRQASVAAAMWNEGRCETFAAGIYDPAAPVQA